MSNPEDKEQYLKYIEWEKQFYVSTASMDRVRKRLHEDVSKVHKDTVTCCKCSAEFEISIFRPNCCACVCQDKEEEVY